MAVVEIKSYGMDLVAGEQTANIRSRIYLYDAKGNAIGLLAFVENGPIPASSLGGGQPVGYYPAALYADAVDMLRNEQPVYLVTNFGRLSISTQTEKVGEGESVGAVAKTIRLPT